MNSLSYRVLQGVGIDNPKTPCIISDDFGLLFFFVKAFTFVNAELKYFEKTLFCSALLPSVVATKFSV